MSRLPGRHRREPRRWRRAAERYTALAAVGAMTCFVALVLRASEPSASPIRPPNSARPAGSEQHAPAASFGVDPAAAQTGPSAPDASPPAQLAVPAIGVHTALQPLGLLLGGSLQSPSHWNEAGWYAGGVIPGQLGPAVIAGHIDSVSGPAVFYRLRELRPGDTVLVTQSDGHLLHFVVDGTQIYPKDNFPTAAVYGPTPIPVLRLITCTGEFDWRTHNYLDNLVVSAHLH